MKMKMLLALAFLCLYITLSEKAANASPSPAAGHSAASPDTTGKKPSLFDSKRGYLLSLQTDSFQQKMKVVKKRRKDVMDFSLILTNRMKNVSDTVSGVLTYVNSGGDESDIADDGTGFFYENWNYTDKNGCQINFRISSDSVKYIRIQDFDCRKKMKTRSPFVMNGVLKRVDIP